MMSRRGAWYEQIGLNECPPKSWVGREFFKSRSIDSWMRRIEENPRLRIVTLPTILNIWLKRKLVNKDQLASIKQMLESPDQENWVIAVSIMKTIAKKKKR
jgi:hypothetical protein